MEGKEGKGSGGKGVEEMVGRERKGRTCDEKGGGERADGGIAI